ncbi:metal ABC transporter solute-binding protein, Zn/Mn family [Streptoalloteichus hindustanus]|uniref:Zinc/manganese transport system substrate-binding protein n=1 Tax=Streptoalloteichus hindustanus TaxID=2017 RepID=A0A1M4W448_STRHI|nr:zinc ABC transporter substrate-binding protein [Streptoalloteichus hindustanus]SHE75925.1 zinc/manganese transport system substrate-binding protein [Streptoalloteichus hindustanus]
MTVRFPRAAGLVAGLAATALALSACGGAGSAASDGDRVRVVASTNVWGSVVQAVGGDAVEVKPIVSDPATDPHSYESTPADAAEVSKARLVVFNGGGYDRFVEKILSSAGGDRRRVEAVKAADHGHGAPATPTSSGAPATAEKAGDHDHGHGHEGHSHDHGVNEHVWYDLHAVGHVADEVAKQLGELKADRKDQFARNAQQFKDRLKALDGKVDEIAAANQGAKVLATEPIAHYLLAQAKLTDVSPSAFVRAVEEGNDPPAAAVAEVEQLLAGGQLRALVHNPQTESPVTRQVREKAQAAKLPVVEMTETLPQGKDYLAWMDEQVANLAKALRR